MLCRLLRSVGWKLEGTWSPQLESAETVVGLLLDVDLRGNRDCCKNRSLLLALYVVAPQEIRGFRVELIS